MTKDSMTQQIFWLIEVNNNHAYYYTGLTGEEDMWSADANAAVRFPTEESAKTVALLCHLYRRSENGGYYRDDIRIVEHMYITDHAALEAARKEEK